MNPDKCVVQYFTKKRLSFPIIRIRNTIVRYESQHKLLGLIIDSPKLSWKGHIEYLLSESSRRLDILKVLSSTVKGASGKMLRNFYIAYIRSKLDYGSIIYSSAHPRYLRKIETTQNKALRFILGARNTSPILSLQAEAYIPPIEWHHGLLHLRQYAKLHSSERRVTAQKLEIFSNESIYSLHSFSARTRTCMQKTAPFN